MRQLLQRGTRGLMLCLWPAVDCTDPLLTGFARANHLSRYVDSDSFELVGNLKHQMLVSFNLEEKEVTTMLLAVKEQFNQNK